MFFPLFAFQVPSSADNVGALSKTKPHTRAFSLTPSNCTALPCSVWANLKELFIYLFTYFAVPSFATCPNTTWCPLFFTNFSLSSVLCLADKSPLRQKPYGDHTENTPKHRGFDLCWNWRRLFAVHQSIPKNETAHSDGESWIYSGQCNSLNCCSCPFIIINQKAAGPKEQFRALRVIPLLTL